VSASDIRRFEPMEYAVGTDGSIVIALKDAAGDALGVTGASATWVLYRAVPRRRRKPFTGNAVLTKTSADSEITLTAGQASVAIDATDLSGKSGIFWQVLKITDSADGVTVLGQGTVYLRAAA
jgi:hypothetical protein